jgi:hypothetical protein
MERRGRAGIEVQQAVDEVEPIRLRLTLSAELPREDWAGRNCSP